MPHIPEYFSPAVAGCGSIPFVDGKLVLNDVPIKHHKEVKRQFYAAFPYLAEEQKPKGEEPQIDEHPLDAPSDLIVEVEPAITETPNSQEIEPVSE